jgi:hypothetical protein
MQEKIAVGFQTFVSDGGEEFGAVRAVAPHGRHELVIYVENAGDFTVPDRLEAGELCFARLIRLLFPQDRRFLYLQLLLLPLLGFEILRWNPCEHVGVHRVAFSVCRR